EHYGQRLCDVPRKQAGRMAVPTSRVKKDQKPLANRGAIHAWHIMVAMLVAASTRHWRHKRF
ncbi:MAG: hypothetical protein ACR2RF_29295, partial [Geminicoccaceae bacterium]